MTKDLIEDAHGNFIDRRRKPGRKIDSIKAGRGRSRPRLAAPEAPKSAPPPTGPRADFGKRQPSLLTTRLSARKPEKP